MINSEWKDEKRRFTDRGGKNTTIAREIVEKRLKRKLKRNVIVHHKNGNPMDDRPSNLEAIPLRKHVSMTFKHNAYRRYPHGT